MLRYNTFLNGGNQVGWRDVSIMLKEDDYEIENKSVRLLGKLARVSIVTDDKVEGRTK